MARQLLPWTEEQLATLVRLRNAGITWPEIARQVGHGPGSCIARYRDWIRGRTSATPPAHERGQKARATTVARMEETGTRGATKPKVPATPVDPILHLAMSARWVNPE